MASLGALSVFLTANTTPFQRRMRRANTVVNSFKRTVMGVGGAIAGAFAVSKITTGISSLIDLGDEIGKASKRIGITAEEYQKLAFAARRAGATSNDVERAFKRMSSTIFDAGKGLKESQDALSKIGLSFEMLNGMKPDKQFAKIADALNKVDDATNKAALAQDIFGRAGTALIPLLNDYKELGDELERIGGIITNENVVAAEEFKDAVEDLTSSIKAMIANSGIIDWLSEVTKSFNELRKSGNSLRLVLDSLFGTRQRISLDAPTKQELKKARKKIADAEKEALDREFDKQLRFRDIIVEPAKKVAKVPGVSVVEAFAEDLKEAMSGPSLSEAVRAGSRAEAALIARTAFGGTEMKMRKKNVDANVATARELKLQNQKGVKVTGMKVVDSVV
jgi:hypothetical protein